MKNSAKYRPPLQRTVDSFIDDSKKIVTPNYAVTNNRANQIRRDNDDVKFKGIHIYDIDLAISRFFEETIKPKVLENGKFIDVPVMYTNPEKWDTIQKDGFMRDTKGKILLPVIGFRRVQIQKEQDLKKNKVLPHEQFFYETEQKYNNNFRYDQFSQQYAAAKPRQFYIMGVPDYVRITYSFSIWCEYNSQLNDLVEQILHYEGRSFGDRNGFKFRSYSDIYDFETVVTNNTDRVVRATFDLVTHAYLMKESLIKEGNFSKRISSKKLFFNESLVDSIEDFKTEKTVPNNGKIYPDDYNLG